MSDFARKEPPILRLELLGPPRLTLAEEPLTSLRSAKARALLAYLVLTGRPHARGTLAHLLWTEMSEADARNNLRVTLATLRKALGDRIVADRHEVAFDLDAPHEVDVRRFLKGLDRSDPTAVLAAVELYRGPLLEGLDLPNADGFHDWLASERDRLHARATEALASAVTASMDRNDARTAIPVLRRLLELEPWLEAAHRELMRVLASEGERDAALRQYEQCRRTLDAEFGVTPSRDTEELHERIRDRTVGAAIALPDHNLPLPTTPLVGREAELRRLVDELRAPGCRIMTLTGPGGVGKTRLALELAWQNLPYCRDGVLLIPLADVHDPRKVLRACAEALGLPSDANYDDLVDHLRDKRMLVVWDNVEQVIDAAGPIARIAARCPSLTFLVTSREPLNVRGERLHLLEPLGVPDEAQADDPETLARVPAVILFAQRAKEVRRNFRLDADNAADVAAICRTVDGLPLAVELAAARLRTQSVHDVVERLNDRFALLRGGPRDLPERHQALWATISWSDELLDPEERRLFHALSVFAGGADPEAVEAIVAGLDPRRTPELLGSLYAKSLLVQRTGPAGEPRFAMLESIRGYATERLEGSGDAEAIREAHARWFHELAIESEPNLRGPDQGRWEARLAAEYENFRVAESWLAEHDPEAALDLIGWFWRFWYQTGRARVGLAVVREALERPDVDRSSTRYAYVLSAAGNLALAQGLLEEARAHHEAALLLRREHGEAATVAASLSNLAVVAAQSRDLERARDRMEEALEVERTLEDRWSVAASLHNLAQIHRDLGELDAARDHFEEAVPIFRKVGDHAAVLGGLTKLTELAYASGRREDVPGLLRRIGSELERGVADASNLVRPLIDLASDARANGDAASADEALGFAVRCCDIESRGRRLATVLARHAQSGFAEGRYGQVALVVGLATAQGLTLTDAEREEFAGLEERTRRELGASFDDLAAFARAWYEGRARPAPGARELGPR